MANPVKPVRAPRRSALSFKQACTLTVRVGAPDKYEDFMIHESFLTARSEYFRRAMNGNWKESETRIVRLEHDEPDVFALYLNHVYTGQLPTMNTLDESTHPSNDDRYASLTEELHRLAAVYILAERLQDSLAKSAALSALIHVYLDESSPIPSTKTIKLVYEGTPTGSPIRRLMVDMWRSHRLRNIFGVAHRLPDDFLFELGTVLDKNRRMPMRSPIELSMYVDSTEESTATQE